MTTLADPSDETAPPVSPLKFEQAQGMVLGGVRQQYTYENMKDIPALWSQFGPRIETIPGLMGAAAYGVIISTSDGSGFDYMAGVEVSDPSRLPSDLTVIQIPAQRYAVFAHPGHVSTLCETIDAAFRQWLPKCGHEHGGYPGFFEKYGEAYDPKTGTGDIEIWLPIKGGEESE